MINLDTYRDLKEDAEEAFQDFLLNEEVKKRKQKESKSGPSPYVLRLNKNGKTFTRIVIDAYNSGQVSPSIASNLLNTQVNKFQKFENLIV